MNSSFPRYALLLAWFTASVLIADISSAQTDAKRMEETERDIKVKEHRRSLEIPSMNPATIRLWGDELGLDNDQRELLNGLVETYLQKIRVLGKTKARVELLWTSAFKYDREKHEVVQTVNPQLLELYEEYFKLLEKIMQADQSLFNAMRTSLDTEAALQLRHIQYNRLRNILKTPYDTEEDAFDLVILVKSLNFSDKVVEKINPVFENYYKDIITLLTDKHYYTSHLYQWEKAQFFYSLGPGWEYAISEEEQKIYQEIWIDVINNRPQRKIKNIGTINWEYIELITRKLSIRNRIKLRAAFHNRIMPELFEEEKLVLKLADNFRKAIGKTPELQERIDIKTEDMMKRLDPLSSQYLFEQILASHPLFPLLIHTHPKDAIIMLYSEISRLKIRLKRRKIMSDFVKSLITIQLSADNTKTSTARTLNSYKEMMEEQDEADEYRIVGLRNRLEILQERQEEEKRNR